MSKEFTIDRDRLERVIADGQKQLSEIEEKITVGDNRRELIDYISVGKRIPSTRDVPIEIHWNF